MPDSLVEQSREVREQLVRQLGGLDGLCDKLEAMDRARKQRQAGRKKLLLPGAVGKSRRAPPAKRTAASS
jgi:hypothetical protein